MCLNTFSNLRQHLVCSSSQFLAFCQREILEEHLFLKCNLLKLMLSTAFQCLCTLPPPSLSFLLEIKYPKALEIARKFSATKPYHEPIGLFICSFICSFIVYFVCFCLLFGFQIGLYVAQASPGRPFTLYLCFYTVWQNYSCVPHALFGL